MTKRLRRWVALSDDEDNSLPYHLDEQEQEEVIKRLKTQNAASNDFFKKSFAVLSLVPTVVFIVIPSHFSLIAILSLSLTAYTAYFLPLSQGILPNNADDGPLRWYPILNGVLAGVVFLDGFIKHRGSHSLAIAAIPGIMWCAIWVARRWATSIDIEGLEKLRYNYKGA